MPTATPDALPPMPPFGAFEYYPDDLQWSTQMLRLFSYASIGGADFGEVEAVARHVPSGDEEAWRFGFGDLARRIDRSATEACDHGHRVSARQQWFRASIYYRMAGQLDAIAGREVPFLDDSRRCFRAAAALADVAIEPVDIAFEGAAMAAYLVAPRGGPATGPGPGPVAGPAVIVQGGIDAFSEEMYHKVGAALSDRGYTVLLLDGPGQGETRARGLHGCADYERACAAAVDHLVAAELVDPERIGFIGASLGGYYAVRAAAFEPRLAATVVWGVAPPFEVVADLIDARATDRVGQLNAFLGLTDPAQLADALRAFDLTGVVEQITGPMLVLHGESDVLVPVAVAHQLYERLTVEDRRLITYPAGTTGCVHCQMDSPITAQTAICDWLDDRLVDPGERR